MRILFALTVTLGVAAPTLTTTNAKSVSYGVFDIAADVRSEQAPQALKPFRDIEIDAGESSETRDVRLDDARSDGSAAVETEEPVAVTVPIERVCEALADAAIAQDLPVGFFARLIWQESRFDQWARSPVGGRGVAQFMPPTAAEYGLQDPFDPIESVAASARFLRQLRDQFGNLGLAAAAYNAGGGRIKKWLNGQSALPQETQNYVSVITGHAAKRWTERRALAVSFALPHRAPCDGVEGLSRDAASAPHQVQLTDLTVELIEQAAAARWTRIASARAAKGRKLAAAKVAAKKRLMLASASRAEAQP